MKKYFAISDMHSFYDPMIKALSDKGFDINNPNHVVIVCGDAFDRGDDTVKVFEFLKELKAKDRLVYIMGNHEDLLFDCITEMSYGHTPGSHHFSNGTVKTICMLCGENEWIVYHPTNDIMDMVYDKTDEVRSFIRENCVNYFALGNKIFVHSWIPCVADDLNMYHSRKTYSKINSIWDKNPDNMTLKELTDYRDAWEAARWGNPFTQWKQGFYPEGKCIVCGHWHCSWGHSHIDMKTPEWPQKNQLKKFEEAFKPYIKDNIIGIDACVAYSGKINCVVFDEEGNLIDYDK